MSTQCGCRCDPNDGCDECCECGSFYGIGECKHVRIVLRNYMFYYLNMFCSSFVDSLLRDLNDSKPIYECNSNCRCPPDCSQRVLQNGCTIPLKVEYISPQTGFGLFSTTEITEGSFIIEYIGELITKDEASLRIKKVNDCT